MDEKELAARIVAAVLMAKHDAKQLEQVIKKLGETLKDVYEKGLEEAKSASSAPSTQGSTSGDIKSTTITYGLPCAICKTYSPSGEPCGVCESKRKGSR